MDAKIHIRSHLVSYFATFQNPCFVSTPPNFKKIILRSFEKVSHKSVLGFVESLLGLFLLFEWRLISFLFAFKTFVRVIENYFSLIVILLFCLNIFVNKIVLLFNGKGVLFSFSFLFKLLYTFADLYFPFDHHTIFCWCRFSSLEFALFVCLHYVHTHILLHLRIYIDARVYVYCRIEVHKNAVQYFLRFPPFLFFF